MKDDDDLPPVAATGVNTLAQGINSGFGIPPGGESVESPKLGIENSESGQPNVKLGIVLDGE